MKSISFILSIGIAGILLVTSCKKPYDGEGVLEFSEDTIRFDTLFTTFASPTQRLIFRNPSPGKLSIDRIFIQGGAASDFRMIVDGIESQTVEGIELKGGDSAIIFIRMKSDVKDDFSRDYLQFVSGGEVQTVVLEAWLMNAFFITSGDLPCGMVFDNSRPVVIDGIVRVPYGCQLTILPGTHVYFTPRKDANFNLISMLLVEGTLQVDGMPGQEVVFSGTRLDGDYPETPAQWRGIQFYVNSNSNYIEHALIKNALFGVEVDSFSISPAPKVRIEQTEIRNMAAYGIWTLGFGLQNPSHGTQVLARNVLIHNCQEATFAMIAGGDAEFYNCTFANYSIDFTRRTPQMGISNYYEDSITTIYPARARFYNSIIWGTEEEEVVLDTVQGYPGFLDVQFDHCLIKSTLNLPGNSISYNADPQFVEAINRSPADRNYRLKDVSPCINAGLNFSSIFNVDLDNLPRDANFDLGCYEYHP